MPVSRLASAVSRLAVENESSWDCLQNPEASGFWTSRLASAVSRLTVETESFRFLDQSTGLCSQSTDLLVSAQFAYFAWFPILINSCRFQLVVIAYLILMIPF